MVGDADAVPVLVEDCEAECEGDGVVEGDSVIDTLTVVDMDDVVLMVGVRLLDSDVEGVFEGVSLSDWDTLADSDVVDVRLQVGEYVTSTHGKRTCVGSGANGYVPLLPNCPFSLLPQHHTRSSGTRAHE